MSKFGLFLYSILHFFTYPLARLLFRFRVMGSENVPDTGPVIIAANHASYVDIPLIGCALKRPTNYMAKEVLFQNPIMGWFYRTLGGLPIRRFHSKEKLGEAVKRLNEGQMLVMYPEGRRSLDGHVKRGMPGIGLLVMQTGARVVPAYIRGTHKVMPVGSMWIRFHPVTLMFGQPIDFKELIMNSEPSKELYREISQRVMTQIEHLQSQVEAVEKGVKEGKFAGKIL